MIELQIERLEAVNVEALNAQLVALLGDQFFGFSIEETMVIVYLAVEVSDTQQGQVIEIVSTHNPDVKTPQQQAEELRLQQLENARSLFASPLLPLEEYASTGAPLLRLAEKISWLEQEMRDLRRNVFS